MTIEIDARDNGEEGFILTVRNLMGTIVHQATIDHYVYNDVVELVSIHPTILAEARNDE